MSVSPIWVFAGPSLPPQLRPRTDGLLWRPPAMAGDGLEALQARPPAVVLIDGVFDSYPAIRHKELMALIDDGVRVIGGASMGALRAAELSAYGMIGAGRIFEAYASGRIVGDDEVAVLHGPAEMDWAVLTIPQVNVRATLQRALRDGVVCLDTARRLRARSAVIFFQDRTWRAVMEAASGAGDGAILELERFAAWVDASYVDLKTLDALECLAAARAILPGARPGGSSQGSTTFTDALAAQVASGLKPNLASPSRRPRSVPPPPSGGTACAGASIR